MKLATFGAPGEGARVGAVEPLKEQLLDLQRAAQVLSPSDGELIGALNEVQTLIDAGPEVWARAKSIAGIWPAAAARPLMGVKLLAPLPRPVQMRDCLVFEKHLQNAIEQWAKLSGNPKGSIPKTWYERPTWYKCNRMSVVGHEHDVIWPGYSEMMDYELELACVIGKRGKDIPAGEAYTHLFGLTIFNDFSARDLQMVERPMGMGPMKSKDFDTGNVLGPWITTLDEFADPNALDMEVRVNGERRGGGNSREMHHSFSDILAFISRGETLYPGEIIASGTVGTGCGLEIGRYLAPDDVVELEIQGIGVLRNRIVRL